MSPIHQSPLKLAVLIVLLAALTIVLAFVTLISSYLPHLWSYLSISLFVPVGIASAVAMIVNGMSLLRPGTLTIDETGVIFRNWRHERRYTWNEVEAFIVFSPQSRLRSPGCLLKSGTRRYVSFGRNWEKTAEEIVEMLNGAKEKFGPAPTSEEEN